MLSTYSGRNREMSDRNVLYGLVFRDTIIHTFMHTSLWKVSKQLPFKLEPNSYHSNIITINIYNQI